MTSLPAKDLTLSSAPPEASISELVELLNLVLSEGVGTVRFHGEVSQCQLAASGHIYLSLSDGQSSIRVTLWSSLARQLKFKIQVGMQLLCVGRPDVYNKSGGLQIILSRCELYGEGALQKRFLELKAKLEREGVFEISRKRELPKFPRALGVVTSKSGAVIHDISVKIRERFPSLDIYLYDARVQGPGSAEEIVAGIQYLNSLDSIDVIIVARGGGSLEDLWSFNEEIVARAVFASRLPIVSGVGHGTDITLSDLAADVRAPTPTAAAEFVTPKRSDLLEALKRASDRLQDLNRWFYPRAQALDELGERIQRAGKNVLERMRRDLALAESKLKRLEPQQQISARKQTLISLSSRLEQQTRHSILSRNQNLRVLTEKFSALNPSRVLERGFAIVQKNGKLVKNSNELSPQDEVLLRFASGSAKSKIQSIH